jgi:hypothetical protein
MGNDGGTIAAKRADLVKTASTSKKEGASPEELAGAVLTTCALSGAPLAPPILCDELGALYNKEAVMEAVVGKTLTAHVPHARSMKADFFAVTPTAPGGGGGGAGAAAGAAVAGAAAERTAVGDALFVCPVTGLAADGRYPCVCSRARGAACAAAPTPPRLHKPPTQPPPFQLCRAAPLRLLGSRARRKGNKGVVPQLRRGGGERRAPGAR